MLVNNPINPLVERMNTTDVPFEDTICVQHKLESVAAQNPDSPAISFEENSLSYSELNKLANALAHKLIEENVQVEDFVVVYLDRGIELMVSIFGILKAGGVYVPTNKEVPALRLSSILDDTAAKIVITTKVYADSIPEGNQALFIDDFIEQTSVHQYSQPEVKLKSTNLAYAIFTSGTTGKPKGVLIEHRSVINRIAWMQKQYPIDASDVLLQKTPITFDVSIWELFWWSFVGAKLAVLPSGYEKSPEQLFQCVQKEKVSVLHFVPSMFTVSLGYLNSVYPMNSTANMKWIFCSGEELLPASVADFYALSSEKLKNKTTLVNLYGPTEATVDVTYYTCSEIVTNLIPIGKPIDNTQIYIINENNEVQAPNTEGELVICGVNLARGYLNNEALTSEKFINLTIKNQTVRGYKTGDKAYVDDSGEIIYKGRIDSQVKIRGYRIELGEIENQVLEIQSVKESACVVEEAGTINARITCYYSKNDSATPEPDFIRYLEARLPKYMIPSKFVELEELPRSLSGKIDRKQLLNDITMAEPDTPVMASDAGANIEMQLEKIWKELLKIDKVPLNAKFFELGGNSLLLIQLSLILKEELDVDIDVMVLFEYPTIKSLAQFIKEGS